MHGQPLRTRPKVYGSTFEPELSERQAMVLRALVSAYVERAAPVASQVLAQQIPVALSSASIRNTLAELQEAGLVEKAHASAGRIPTPLGLRTFIDHLLEPTDLGPDDQRRLDRALEGVEKWCDELDIRADAVEHQQRRPRRVAWADADPQRLTANLVKADLHLFLHNVVAGCCAQ